MNIMEAFKALDALNEDTFSIDDDGIKKLSEFEQNDDLLDELSVIDTEAETEDELKDSYVGKIILDCPVCHSKLYKDKDDVKLDDNEEFANVGDECPYCYTSDGFKVIGEVSAFEEETNDTEEQSDEHTEDSESLDESLTEDFRLNDFYNTNDINDSEYQGLVNSIKNGEAVTAYSDGRGISLGFKFTPYKNGYQVYDQASGVRKTFNTKDVLIKNLYDIVTAGLDESLTESKKTYSVFPVKDGEHFAPMKIKAKNDKEAVELAKKQGKYKGREYDFEAELIENLEESLSESISSILSSLNEAEMSDEDKHDNEILKGIQNKITGRLNAKLTPEEKDILKKYNLTPTKYNDGNSLSIDTPKPQGQTYTKRAYETDLFDTDRKPHGEYKDGWTRYSKQDYNKINYADRARKYKDRAFTPMTDDDKWAEKKAEFKNNLSSKKYYQKTLDTLDTSYDAKIAKLEKELADVKSRRETDRDYYQTHLDDTQGRINKALKKNESLTEAVGNNITIDDIKQLSPKDTRYIQYKAFETNKGFELYAQPTSMTSKINVSKDDIINKLDNQAINAMEDWVNRIYELDPTISGDDIDSDWFSGMSLFNKGNKPLTYKGFTFLLTYSDEGTNTVNSQILYHCQGEINFKPNNNKSLPDPGWSISVFIDSDNENKAAEIFNKHLKETGENGCKELSDKYNDTYSYSVADYSISIDKISLDDFNKYYPNFEVLHESLNEATATLERPMSKLGGTLSNVLTAHQEELSQVVSKKEAIDFLNNLEPEIKNKGYLKTVLQQINKMPEYKVSMFLYNIILKGDGMGTNESLDESVENISIETNDDTINVIPGEDGKVDISTEPKTPAEGETIVPVSDETKSDIENSDTDTEDVEFNDFDEESFNELGESYLKNIYENVDSFKLTNASMNSTKMVLEGVIKFNTGNEKTTKFIFESKDINRSKKLRLIGENVNITKGKKAFTLKGSVNNGRFICESFNYNYRTNNNGKSNRVYGTVKTSKGV